MNKVKDKKEIQEDRIQIDEILRLPDICKVTKMSKTTVYDRVKKKDFPKPIQVTERLVGWLGSEINDWLRNRPRVERYDESFE